MLLVCFWGSSANLRGHGYPAPELDHLQVPVRGREGEREGERGTEGEREREKERGRERESVRAKVTLTYRH